MDIKAKKSLGQNFLIDREVLDKIVSTCDIANKEILEIGPGTGNLTTYILKKKPKKVYVVEKDDELAILLADKFTNEITIINDDVLNISGHRLGTAEIESALVLHSDVSEAAVVGMPHDIKGQGIYAYVSLMTGVIGTEELKKDLVALVRKEIGPIATVDKIQFAQGLPKTRSGKIMRRILRKIAEDDYAELGDTSTLSEPGVVDDLIKNRV